MNLGDRELSAMLNENWTQPDAPLLVLSTVSTTSTPSLSCATVVELLQLRRFNRPWQVSLIHILLSDLQVQCSPYQAVTGKIYWPKETLLTPLQRPEGLLKLKKYF